LISAMRYRLRTLLILLAIGPPMLAGAWWYVRIPGTWRSCLDCVEFAGYIALLFAPIATLMAVAWVASQSSATITKR
jgi:hypothetical protein